MSSPYNGAVDISPKSVIKITFNKPIIFGNKKITLKSNTEYIVPLTLNINNNVLILNHNALSKGDRYIITIASGSVKDLSGKVCSLYTTSFTISSLTMAQMTDGISRVQKFYTKNHRLPAYVIFGDKKILIKNFQAIIEAYRLKIKY
ncbi:MAG: Ig-like domain-containing protein [Methanobacterium sp.]|nr:Ig-like domain-containing protein [Methanobacterium sp.]